MHILPVRITYIIHHVVATLGKPQTISIVLGASNKLGCSLNMYVKVKLITVACCSFYKFCMELFLSIYYTTYMFVVFVDSNVLLHMEYDWVFLIQSSAITTWSSITWYCTHYCTDWGRIWMWVWHPPPPPHTPPHTPPPPHTHTQIKKQKKTPHTSP